MQEPKKAIDDIDVLTLPPRSERLLEEEGLTSRVSINKRKEEIKKDMRMKYLIIKILLCLFIPIPIVFIVYMYQPHLFDVFRESHTTSDSIFETIQISRAQGRETDEITGEQGNLEEATSSGEDEEEQSSGYIYHVVEEGETIYTISMKYFGNREGEALIRSENNLTTGELAVGQRLKIPQNSVNE